MATGDVYQLIDNQTLNGQDVKNVYYYLASTGTVDSEDLADEWYAQLLPDLRPVETADLFHTTLDVLNLFDSGDFYTRTNGNVGTYAGGTAIDTLPPHDAMGYLLGRSAGQTRNGAKRFAGVPEPVVADGIITNAGFITAMSALADALIAPMLDIPTGLITHFLPIIVKRILVSAGPPRKYRLPAYPGELVYSNVVAATPDLNVSSQVSRKIGRGA